MLRGSKLEPAAEEPYLRGRQDDLMKPTSIRSRRQKEDYSCSGLRRFETLAQPLVNTTAIRRIAPNYTLPRLP